MCVALKLRSLHFAHPVYVASRYCLSNFCLSTPANLLAAKRLFSSSPLVLESALCFAAAPDVGPLPRAPLTPWHRLRKSISLSSSPTSCSSRGELWVWHGTLFKEPNPTRWYVHGDLGGSFVARRLAGADAVVALGAIDYPLNLTRRQRRNANSPQQCNQRRKQASPNENGTPPKPSRSRKGAQAETVTPLTSDSSGFQVTLHCVIH